jgi:hypothetical protein
MGGGNFGDDGLLNFERSGAGGVEIGEGIFKESLNAVGGDAGRAGDFNGRCGGVVGAD